MYISKRYGIIRNREKIIEIRSTVICIINSVDVLDIVSCHKIAMLQEITNRPTESDQKFIYFATESEKTISDLPSFVSFLSPKGKEATNSEINDQKIKTNRIEP